MKSEKDLILQDMKSLLQFQLKHARRHGLDCVKLTVPRARLFIREISKANKAKPDAHLSPQGHQTKQTTNKNK